MTAETAQREPTMEEILASIRRIISEEDPVGAPEGGDVLELQPEAPAPAPAAAAPAAEDFGLSESDFGLDAIDAEPAPEPTPPSALPVDDLMVMEREPEEMVQAPEPPKPAYTPPPASARAYTPPGDDSLVGEPAARRAAGALGQLMGSMLVSSGATLDDVVRELLKPMLKDWLEANLPAIVEAEVAREIERIRRMAR